MSATLVEDDGVVFGDDERALGVMQRDEHDDMTTTDFVLVVVESPG